LKTIADVPKLVDDLIAASTEVTAIGDIGYWIIALDDPEANTRIEKIVAEFGPRDHLFADIIACLNAKGRRLPIEPHTCSCELNPWLFV